MSNHLLSRLGAAIRGYWVNGGNLKDPELAKFYELGRQTRTKIVVSEDTALNYAALWAAVSVIAGDVATLPLNLYKRLPNSGKDLYSDSKLFRILHDEPNPEMSSVDFREALTVHLLTWGNGFAEIQRDQAGRVVALWPITPDRVQPFRETLYRADGSKSLGPLLYKIDGTLIMQPWEVLHLHGLGWDGTTGYSVIARMRECIGLGLAAEQFGAAFYGNGSTFGGVLSSPNEIGPEEAEEVRKSIEALHQSTEKAHRFLVLGGGFKYEKLGVPPNDAQFLETRKFQKNEIATWLRIPPHKLGDLDRATFSNIEQQDLEYYKGCLRHWLVRWEQEINRKLISPLERNQQFVKFNVDAFLRGDSAGRAQLYRELWNVGAITQNEIREKEDLNPIAGGDTPYVPLNMVPSSLASEKIQAEIDKAKQPPAPPVQPPEPKAEPDDSERQHLQRQLEEAIARERQLADEKAAAVRAEAEAKAAAERAEHERAEQTEAALRFRAEWEQAQVAAATERDRAVKAEADAAAERERREAEAARAVAGEQAKTEAERLAVAEAAKREAAERQADELRAALDIAKGEAETARQAVADAAQRESDAAMDARRSAESAELAEKRAADLRAEADSALTDRAAAEALAQEAEAKATEARQVADALKAEHESTRAALTEKETEAARLAVALTDAGKQLLEAEGALAALKERADQERQARETAERALAEEREAAKRRMVAVIDSHRALFVDALGRMTRREAEKARRHQATPEKLRAWLENFDAIQEQVCVDALLPAMRAHLAWMGKAEDPLSLTAALVKDHLNELTRRLRAVIDSDPDEYRTELERTLARWETERAGAVADQIMREEIDHVTH